MKIINTHGHQFGFWPVQQDAQDQVMQIEPALSDSPSNSSWSDSHHDSEGGEDENEDDMVQGTYYPFIYNLNLTILWMSTRY